MPFSLSSHRIRGIVLDVEGTTTPVAFVYEVLFPYVRHELREFLKTYLDDPEVREAIRALKLEHDDDEHKNFEPPVWTDELDRLIPSVEAYVNWLMNFDRKSTALKQLQGKVWQDGYRVEKLRGQVFPDVPPALQRWHKRKFEVRIYSSGSELAQRLLFGNTVVGDLTPYLSGYFDTRIGNKGEDRSYMKIAEVCGILPEHMVFVSDVTRELDAARQAGMKTVLCLRPGNHPQILHGHDAISTFNDIAD